MPNPIAQEIMKYTSELSRRGEYEKALGYLHEQEKSYPQEPYILIMFLLNKYPVIKFSLRSDYEKVF